MVVREAGIRGPRIRAHSVRLVSHVQVDSGLCIWTDPFVCLTQIGIANK